MRDQIRSHITMLRDELGLWLTIVALCFVFLVILASCKGPDAGARVLSTFTVAYTDGSGTSTHGGTIDNPGYTPDSAYSGSSDSDFHAWTFSISPLVAMHDPSARTRETLEQMLAELRYQKTEPVASGPAPASGGCPEGSATGSASPVAGVVEARSTNPSQTDAPATDLPWWKDTALLIGYATVLGAIVAGIFQGWKRVKPVKE